MPSTIDGFGYDWMGSLEGSGWHEVSSWGRSGWDLGSWPLVIVAHHDGEGVYGMVTYVEGDLDVKAFTTRADRDAATDEAALYWWRYYDHGPWDLPETVDELPPAYRGPFSFARMEAEAPERPAE